MKASLILTDAAVLMLVAILWVELGATGRRRPMYRAWLMAGGIFALAGILTSLLR